MYQHPAHSECSTVCFPSHPHLALVVQENLRNISNAKARPGTLRASVMVALESESSPRWGVPGARCQSGCPLPAPYLEKPFQSQTWATEVSRKADFCLSVKG